MNLRTKKNLDAAEEVIDELNEMYLGYIDETDNTDLREIDPPIGFIPSSQKVQFQAALKKLRSAIMNVYPKTPKGRKEIAEYTVTIDNLINASKEVKGDYPALYDFYLNHFLPVAEEIISFCNKNDQTLPRAKRTLTT